MKKKLFIISILLSIGIIISLYLTTVINISIRENHLEIHQLKLSNCINTIATDKTAQLLFLCFVSLTILCIVMLIFNRRGSEYETKLVKITDNISTPVPVGQK